MRAIQDEGGIVVVQRPERALASAMPKAALEACPNALVLDLTEIADYLAEVGKQR